MFRHKKSARKGEFPALQRGGLNILILPEMLLFSVRRGEDSVHRDEDTVVIENKSICTVENEE